MSDALRTIADRIREGGPDAAGWLRVLRVYQSGRRAYPEPFVNRRPAREARRPQ